MKKQFTAMSVVVALVVVSGCKKQEPTTTPEISSIRQAATQAVENVKSEGERQTQNIQQKAQEAAGEASAQVEATGAKVQGLIAEAGRLIGEKKWSEALGLLNQLSGQQLTAEQQSAVQALKQQAQAAVDAAKTKAADEASKAAGGLLPPKP